jgi:energy-coupling factor transporter ATP-binding protein EcfA2
MINIESIAERLRVRLPTLINIAVDPSLWALDQLNIDLYDNQIEIVNDVCDLASKYTAILQTRGSGKSFSVALALIKLCLDNPGFKVGIFGPKTEQATRIIKVIKDEILTPNSPAFTVINWDNSTNSKLKFNNGSEMIAISASPTAQQEGWHFHCIVGSTKIQTENGEKTVEELYNTQSFVNVYTFNEKTQTIELKPLEFIVKQNTKKKFCKITTQDDKQLTCTEDHKIFVKDKGWIEAKDLREDDVLLQIEGKC